MKSKTNTSTGFSDHAATASSVSRRAFLGSVAIGSAALGIQKMGVSAEKKKEVIQGFEETAEDSSAANIWTSVSDRQIRVGLVGHGYCKFGVRFGFQDHPNVEVVAVSDLIPDRCAEMAREAGCEKTYPSLEEMVKDDTIEAVFLATDAPSHARHAILSLEHGKHVASAVPAVFGSLEDAERLYETVKNTGLKYMLFETSMFHTDLYAMRQIYMAGGLGEIVYSEGEYYHFLGDDGIGSYKDWRIGLPPQYYPTHSNAYFIAVTGQSFTEVSCLGMRSVLRQFQPGNNRYENPYGSEVALFRTSSGGMSRMAVSWDTPGDHGEKGRIRGQRGSFYGEYEGFEKDLPNQSRPGLPPGVAAGGHGGSHGRLTDEFITAILQDRAPLIAIDMALNMTVSGIVAHHSALKDGELLKIPQYAL